MFANLHTQTTVFVHPVRDKHTTGLYQKQTTYKSTGEYIGTTWTTATQCY